MTDTFDPYHRWLGISPKHQPPNHYRLLGLEEFEDDPEVIHDAAERQIRHVRSYELGQHAALAQQLLNDLARAKAILSNEAKRKAYEESLRKETSPVAAAVSPLSLPEPMEGHLPPPPSVPARRATPRERANRRKARPAREPKTNEAAQFDGPRPQIVSEPYRQPTQTIIGRSSTPRASAMQRTLAAVRKIQPTWYLVGLGLFLVVGLFYMFYGSGRAGEERELTLPNNVKLNLVWCPPGKFMMGSPQSEQDRIEDEDQVTVTLSQGFWLGQTEVTQGQFREVMGMEPPIAEKYGAEGDDCAATYVSYDDALEFCRKLTASERRAGRLDVKYEYTLPTEAQWEYACRAGTTTRYSFGEDEGDLSNYAWWGGIVGDGNAKDEKYAHQVGLKKPNAWGLHDMHGNVWEWCLDGYEAKLRGGRDPLVKEGSYRVRRGGGWYGAAKYTRSAFRHGINPSGRSSDLGFRVALSPSAK